MAYIKVEITFLKLFTIINRLQISEGQKKAAISLIAAIV